MKQFTPQYKSKTTGEWCNFTDTKPVIIEAEDSYWAEYHFRIMYKKLKLKVRNSCDMELDNRVRLTNGDFVMEVGI
jgi:hypothetical protein